MSDNTILYLSPTRLKLAQKQVISACDYELVEVTQVEQMFEFIETSIPSILLIDSDTGDAPIDQVLPQVLSVSSKIQIVCLVESNESALASKCIELGAVDYLIKPFLSGQLHTCIKNINALVNGSRDMITVSRASRSVLQMANRVANTQASVLIMGESGTGKERLAQFIHNASSRKDAPYIAVNCAAIPENMLEGILFGHTKGAFTGAVANQIGKFEAANGGTLLLDEISELPITLQGKLLRVLQEREVERLGSNSPIKLDVRIVAATNKDLVQQIQKGLFREDLYYRLQVLPLSIPALRERREDIIPLAKHFISKYQNMVVSQGRDEFSLSGAAQNILYQYNWPGNVRELENVIQRAIVMARGAEIQIEDLELPIDISSGNSEAADYCASALKESKQMAEQEYIINLLRKFNGRRTDTAKALGMSTRALRYKLAAMKEQGIDISNI